MQRVAHCSCGAVRVDTAGSPSSVVACHCLECQRRTGSVFGVGAYFRTDQVTMHGDTRSYQRRGASGAEFRSHFCPICGSTVYWYAEKVPDHVGVAVGAFAEAAFPAPVRSVWEQSMHRWVSIDTAHQHYPAGRTG